MMLQHNAGEVPAFWLQNPSHNLRVLVNDRRIRTYVDAGVSMLTGSATAHKTTIGTSKSYNVQRDFVFEAKVFAELKNAQAIVLAYDGLNPHPPTYCYLKPYYLDPNDTYFEQLAKGTI